MLLSGIAPSLSRAWAAAPPADVCSVDRPARPAAPGHGDATHEAACAWCTAQGASSGAPPPARATLPALRPIDEPPRVEFVRFAASGSRWNAAAPRGPPTADVG